MKRNSLESIKEHRVYFSSNQSLLVQPSGKLKFSFNPPDSDLEKLLGGLVDFFHRGEFLKSFILTPQDVENYLRKDNRTPEILDIKKRGEFYNLAFLELKKCLLEMLLDSFLHDSKLINRQELDSIKAKNIFEFHLLGLELWSRTFEIFLYNYSNEHLDKIPDNLSDKPSDKLLNNSIDNPLATAFKPYQFIGDLVFFDLPEELLKLESEISFLNQLAQSYQNFIEDFQVNELGFEQLKFVATKT